MFDYLGKTFKGSDYTWARYYTQKVARDVEEQMQPYDAVIMPVIATEPAELGVIRPSKSDELINQIIMKLRLGWIFNIPTLRNKILDGLGTKKFVVCSWLYVAKYNWSTCHIIANLLD